MMSLPRVLHVEAEYSNISPLYALCLGDCGPHDSLFRDDQKFTMCSAHERGREQKWKVQTSRLHGLGPRLSDKGVRRTCGEVTSRRFLAKRDFEPT